MNKNSISAEVYNSIMDLIQRAINSGSLSESDRVKLHISFYNDQKTGLSKIYIFFGIYAPMVVELNNLQRKLLLDYAKDGQPRQIFPLPQEVVDSASEEELKPVENIRIGVLEEIVNSIGEKKRKDYCRIKVYPYNKDITKIDLRIRTPYATLNFYVDRREEVVQQLRQKHMIL